MGLEMESDYEKSSTVGLSPNTVLPSKQSSKRSSNGRHSRKDELLVLKEDFREISFSRYHRSVSCNNIPPRRASRECNVDLRRGSIYQSSREVRRMREMGVSEEGRRKIEISSRSDISFSIVDSLCRSDEAKLKRRPSKGSLDPPRPIPKPASKASSSDGFFEIRLDLGHRAIENSAEDSNPRSECVTAAGPPESDSNEPLERDCSSKAGSRTRFGPIRKIFDPFVKSKSSRRSPLSHPVGPELAERAKESENDPFGPSSPVHLCGYLKLEDKQGLPFFEFSLRCPEDVFVAKTWKARDGFNWVYTFHSADNNGKKSNASSRLGIFDNDNNNNCNSSPVVGQMRVSCYLCSELNEGVFENSMVTEFVLHDVSHARPSSASSELDSNSGRSPNPSLEIAAIVMQAPFEKRESLKHKDLLGLSMVEPRTVVSDRVTVVMPAGSHGSPGPESGPGSPSPLLERWRLGGGCDCGGWDMGCPLTVLGNPHFRCGNSQSIVDNHLPMELFLQGSKDDKPALTMKVVEEGLYAVDFHAQLSTLQAFSICVAILHGTETSSGPAEERYPHDLSPRDGNSLKALIEEEVKFLIEAVAAEKKNVAKRVKEIPPSYVLNPPFSPIARV